MLMQTSQLNIQVLSVMKCVVECKPTFLACDNDDPVFRLFSLAVHILKGITELASQCSFHIEWQLRFHKQPAQDTLAIM